MVLQLRLGQKMNKVFWKIIRVVEYSFEEYLNDSVLFNVFGWDIWFLETSWKIYFYFSSSLFKSLMVNKTVNINVSKNIERDFAIYHNFKYRIHIVIFCVYNWLRNNRAKWKDLNFSNLITHSIIIEWLKKFNSECYIKIYPHKCILTVNKWQFLYKIKTYYI